MDRKKLSCTFSCKIDHEKIKHLAKQSIETFVDLESKCIHDVDIEACIRDWINVVVITHNVHYWEVV